MSENNALVPVRNEMTLQETMTLGDTLAKSGFFSDAKQAAQAVVKILAGRELGLGPIASMTGISIIKGQVSLGANLMATTVKRDPRYDYRVAKHDAEICSIVFYQNGEIVGTSTFTLDDADKAGLSGDNWRKYPRNMLFARAMSNGVRWYCPDAFGGSPTYTPEELGAETDGEGNVIEGQFHDTPRPTPTPAKSNGQRPMAPEFIKDHIAKIVENGKKDLASDAQRGLIASKLEECFSGDKDAKAKRYKVMWWLSGITSTGEMTKGHADGYLKWLLAQQEKDDSGDYPLHPKAPAEAAAIYREALKDDGQSDFAELTAEVYGDE